MKRRILSLVALMLILASCLSLASCFALQSKKEKSFSLDTIPEFDGENAYVVINDNKPFFE